MKPTNFLQDVLYKLVQDLNEIGDQTEHAKIMQAHGGTWERWKIGKVGKKFVHINIGSSAAFLVDGNGELYNTKGAGVPDYNKKVKADIGNVYTVDPKVLYTKRWNYLR